MDTSESPALESRLPFFNRAKIAVNEPVAHGHLKDDRGAFQIGGRQGEGRKRHHLLETADAKGRVFIDERESAAVFRQQAEHRPAA